MCIFFTLCNGVSQNAHKYVDANKANEAAGLCDAFIKLDVILRNFSDTAWEGTLSVPGPPEKIIPNKEATLHRAKYNTFISSPNEVFTVKSTAVQCMKNFLNKYVLNQVVFIG